MPMRRALTGFRLTPDFSGLGRGLQLGRQLQADELNRQLIERQIAREDEQAAELQTQRALAARALGVDQPQPLQAMGVQMPETAPGVSGTQARPDLTSDQAIARLFVMNPKLGEQVLGSVGLIDQQKRNEAADFAFRIQDLPEHEQNIAINQRIQKLRAQNRDSSHTEQLLGMNPQRRQQTFKTIQLAALSPQERLKVAQGGSIPAGIQEFQFKTQNLTDEEKLQAAKIDLGLAPRAVGTGAITTAQEGLTDVVAESEAVIEGAKAGAREKRKLQEQRKLLPEVQSAVTTAVANATAQGKLAEQAKSDEKAFNIYNTAMTGLVESMGDTFTGPIVGLMPAITADAQIAEGAVSAMAPILKQLFRAAGEGSFTDSDQELLLNMVPTRRDLPAARRAKLQNIDAIVRAKLGQPPTTALPTIQEINNITDPAQLRALREQLGGGQ